MSLDPMLLEILACPEDKGPLFYLEDEDILYNPRLRRIYRIEDDNFNIDLWLCPALLKYFDIAPHEIYVKVEEYN